MCSRDRPCGFQSQLHHHSRCTWPGAHSLLELLFPPLQNGNKNEPIKLVMWTVSDRLMFFSLPLARAAQLCPQRHENSLSQSLPSHHSPPFWLMSRLFKEHELTALGSWSPQFGRLDQTWHGKEMSVGKNLLKKCMHVVKCISNCNINIIALVGVCE